MHLALDFGNTRVKAGWFGPQGLIETKVFDSAAQFLDVPLTDITHCIIGSVTGDHEPVLEVLKAKFDTLLFEATTPIPLKNLYSSALTLGSDRLAASVGAFQLFPGRNVLTIDAGTCIKYNFVNSRNEYLGGAISPGIPMRLKAMHEYTQRLPLVSPDPTYDKLTGSSTAESLLSGAVIGAACEADGMIGRYEDAHNDLQVVITGGDAPYLCKQLKSRFFAHQNLLLQGLHVILRYNL
jgi:type III pantothenate kinase